MTTTSLQTASFKTSSLARSEKAATRLVSLDIVQRTLIEQTLGRLYKSVQAKCQLKLDMVSQQLMPPYIRKLMESVPRTIIVEVNCGYGFMANYLSLCSPDTHIVGIDSRTERIEEAKTTVNARQNLQFIGQDLSRIPKVEADLIIVNLAQWDEQALQQLERLHQWLTPGGDILIRTRHPKTQWQSFFQNMITNGPGIAVQQLRNAGSETNSIQWQKRLAKAGFTCLAEYDAVEPVNTTGGKLASFLNGYVWYHAEKPIYSPAPTKKFNASIPSSKPYATTPQLRYSQNNASTTEQGIKKRSVSNALHLLENKKAASKTHADGEDALEYIFSKPWKCLKQEISPA